DGFPFTRERDALVAAEDKEAEVRGLVAEWRDLVKGHVEPQVDGISWDEWLRLLEGMRRVVNGGRDPLAGLVTFRQWVEETWLPAQDLEDSSLIAYRQHLRLRIYPEFENDPVGTITSPHRVRAWEIRLRKRYADNTVSNTRNLLATILSDLVAEGLLKVNPAAKRRGRGKVSERRLERDRTPRQWATPLQVLLLAERA
ncbi:hypothetical protein ACFQ07_09430, partial [Actinomadura adrarensis]